MPVSNNSPPYSPSMPALVPISNPVSPIPAGSTLHVNGFTASDTFSDHSPSPLHNSPGIAGNIQYVATMNRFELILERMERRIMFLESMMTDSIITQNRITNLVITCLSPGNPTHGHSDDNLPHYVFLGRLPGSQHGRFTRGQLDELYEQSTPPWDIPDPAQYDEMPSGVLRLSFALEDDANVFVNLFKTITVFDPIGPTPLASLAPLSRTETATALSATAASDSSALETTTAEPRVTSGMVEPTNSRTLRKQSSHSLAVASGSGDSGEPGKRKGKEKEVVPSHPEPSSSSSMLAIPGEKEAFDFFHLTPPPATETAMKAKDCNNDNVARLAVAIHHLQLQGNTEHIGVRDDITTLAAVQASFREALDTHQGASSAGPSLPSSLVAFPEWHDIHAAVSSLQDCASSQSAERLPNLEQVTNDLQSLRIPNVQKQILDLQRYLETEVAEMRGRLSSQALSQPTLQPFPSLGAGDAPLASGSRFISPMMTPSTYVSPYGGATVKHSLPETFPQAAKCFHQEDEGTELLVKGVRNEETTAAVARRILSTTDTAFVKVLAAYRLRDRSASPHVVLRFKTSDSASRFLRIVIDACPLELHGLQFRLIPRPAADNTVSYETLQTRWNPLPPRSDIRAPELQGQLRAEYPSTGW
ncbi:hypothetical protein BDP27DRAFT_1366651 [Rhodocollybia butyracea]|uniref:Uncharacterized protein n=1 Tax=Rhodocollybia butyracea TaxID=206335 RepID=A0A9P5PMD2_9AGAR|nr:hypothetical protein BDP27DRAFT_1366651 [Rhodocollybia butyracea]